jgi:acyl carrier protein
MKTEDYLFGKMVPVLSKALDLNEKYIGLDAAMGVTEKWDSFGQLNLVLLIENEFEVSIPDDLVSSLTSLKGIISWLMLQP